MLKPIAIVGGGLAGLTLGIGLRERGVPVVVWEAGHYPRQRVCGEFISGQGQQTLRRLGLLPLLFDRGAGLARTAAFFSIDSSAAGTAALPLPQPAICLSRHILDATLAEEFRRRGGALREDERWNNPGGEGVVWASGRVPSPAVRGWRWIGIKAHAQGVRLTGDLEIHTGSSGYVGICRLNKDLANICALLRTREPLADLARTWTEHLRGPAGSTLRDHTGDAQFVAGSFCSTAGISLAPRKAAGNPELRIGDALTMIAPITGNGMSMAFEAAALALEPLEAYSRNAIPWKAAMRATARRCDRAFARRLRCGALFHKAAFRPRLWRALVAAAGACPPIWRLLFTLTR